MRFLVLLCLVLSAGAAENQHRTWMDYGGGPDSSKYVALDQITKTNVDQLRVEWVYPTKDGGSYVFNPIVVDNVMYLLARNDSLVALDATTGEEIWIHEGLNGISSRGINYWESEDRKDRRLILSMRNSLQAIDAQTGKSILSFGDNGLVDLRVGLDRDPDTIFRVQSGTPGRIFEDLIILGSATGEGYFATPGHLRAYNVVTGELAWKFRTIPHPDEFGYDTWPKDAWKYIGGANTWGEISLDEERGIAYFPIGSPTYDYYGADRIGANLFANCLLALDARTGKRRWHQQLVHHDLWDYDNASAPQLITVEHDGETIDAVAQATKQGFLFVFNRVTGEPLWPIEEREVPPSDVPGEEAWPTQPFPTAPPPFSRQTLTADDVNPYFLTDEERANWKDRIASARKGLFTPPSLEAETIAMPGAVGGANWGTTSANPEKGLVYVLTQDKPSFYNLGPEVPGADRARGMRGAQAVYAKRCALCHGDDQAGSVAFPSLLDLGSRVSEEEFRLVVTEGKGEMPAYGDMDDEAVENLYRFLTRVMRRRGRSGPLREPLGGPVVASGGAPGSDAPRPRSEYFGMAGPPYPEGIDVPENRYYTDYGLGYPHVVSPPWSSIVAYDLNKGTIKWRRALGEDAIAVAQGAKEAGMLTGSQRHGAIVTSTGLIFVATRDGKLRAFDEDNGRVLWTADLPGGSEGIPAMYQVDGRQYLVVPASSSIVFGPRNEEPPDARDAKDGRGYVVFALPEKSD